MSLQVLSKMFSSSFDIDTCLIFPWAERQVAPTFRFAASLGSTLRRDLRWSISVPKLQRLVLSVVTARHVLDRAAFSAALDFCIATRDRGAIWSRLAIAVAGRAGNETNDAVLDLLCGAFKDGIIGVDVAPEYDLAVRIILGRTDDNASAAKKLDLVASAPKRVLEIATTGFVNCVLVFLRWVSEAHPQISSTEATRWVARCFSGEARDSVLALILEIEMKEVEDF